ncbi:MAG TPA: hypothetical protein VNR60_07960 [Croceibacterium sp.]|nr:hypothetical protein [Croceibacterium sp.]
MAEPADDEIARKRWAVIQAARLGGAVLILAGILIRYQAVPGPLALGVVLIAAGMLGFFLLPTLLARRWRTPR